MEEESVVLTVTYGGRVLDEIVFSDQTGKKKAKRRIRVRW
ncbi:conserved hypothetical protein [delta proteobacterium NaphS2]|nr:conserved hypothetical protein [delta proteobacterium NaphS2]